MTNFEVDNKVWQKDIDLIANDEIVEQFKNSSFLITGASGLIGSEIVFSLLAANRIKGLNNKIYALARNENKAKEKFKNVLKNENFKLIIQDINQKLELQEKIDYVIHTAGTTSSFEMLNKPVDTICTIFNGTKNVLDFACENKIKSLIYLSSLEIYGTIRKDELIREDDFGYVDLKNPRSSYPEAKRMAENLCCSYSCQFGLDVKIARLTQTFGAGISKDDNRVFAQFVKSVVENKDIILHTEGKTTRNYCYLTDAIIAIFTILKNGVCGENYNVANKNTNISILDMANLVANNNNIEVDFENDNKNRGYNPTIKACLDTQKLENLGWSAKINLNDMFENTISYLREEVK